MKITFQDISRATSKPWGGLAINSYQLRLLGMKWPPERGWVRKLVGREIDDKVWDAVLELNGENRRNRRRRILKEIGTTPADLFRGIELTPEQKARNARRRERKERRSMKGRRESRQPRVEVAKPVPIKHIFTPVVSGENVPY